MSKTIKKVSYERMNGEDRKRQILLVARCVFAEENYYGATMAKIAREANVTEPTIYLYFKNKRELFMEVVRDCTEFQLNSMKQIIEGSENLRQAYINVFREHRKFISKTLDMEKILDMARIMNDPEIKAITRKFNGDVHEAVSKYIQKGMDEGLIRNDVDPGALARVLMGVVGAMRTMLLVESDEDVDKVFIEVVELLEKANVKV